jgi:hypothetical protein
VVRERWVKLTEDKRQQNEEEIIIGNLFVYLFEYIPPSIIYYVKEALFMIQIIITVCIVLFIFKMRENLLGSFCEGERRKLDKAQNVKISLYI